MFHKPSSTFKIKIRFTYNRLVSTYQPPCPIFCVPLPYCRPYHVSIPLSGFVAHVLLYPHQRMAQPIDRPSLWPVSTTTIHPNAPVFVSPALQPSPNKRHYHFHWPTNGHRSVRWWHACVDSPSTCHVWALRHAMVSLAHSNHLDWFV